MITILIATYNSENTIRKTMDSLKAQTNNNFKVLIIDNQSTDKTINIIKSYNFELKVVIEPDCGIYHALNKGIKFIDTEYYIVCGSDDSLEKNCIEEALNAISQSHADFITWNVAHGNKTITPKGGHVYKSGARAVFASHSAGIAIKKAIHELVGSYNTLYRICADQDLILKSHKMNFSFYHLEETLGIFTPGGLSTNREHKLMVAYEEYIISQKWYPSLYKKLKFILRIIKT